MKVILFDQFIDFFNSNDPLICKKIFALTIEQDEIAEVGKKFLKAFNLFDLIKIFPAEDWPLFLQEIPYFFADKVIDEIKTLCGVDVSHEDGFNIGE